MRNRDPGICYRCGETVAVGEGHFEKHQTASGKWRTQHADCAIRWRGKPAPTMAEAKAARQPHARATLLRHDKLARSGTRHAVKNAATLSVDVLMVTVAPHAFIAA